MLVVLAVELLLRRAVTKGCVYWESFHTWHLLVLSGVLSRTG